MVVVASDMPRAGPSAVTLTWPDKRSEPPSPSLPGWPAPTRGAGLLLHADNTAALAHIAHHADVLGPVDCCYADPPYATGLAHGVRDHTGSDLLAYDDRDTGPEYCQAMLDRLHLVHRVLAPHGVVFIQCDWRTNALWRLLLDEVFGPACFRNEIIWRRAPNLGRQASGLQLGRTTDSILVYTRRAGVPFRGLAPVLLRPVVLTKSGKPSGARWDAARQCFYTTAPRGDYTDASIDRLRKQGRVHETSRGTVSIKYFLERDALGRWCKRAPVDTIWDDEQVRPLRFAPKAELAVPYVTQKPESLLRRIVQWATREGDLVLDPFCGSGTTLVVAQQLGRRWVGCDRSAHAISVASARLAALGAGVSCLGDPSTGAGASTVQRPRRGSQGAAPRVVRGKHRGRT